MALVKEDGTQVTGANTYVDDAEYVAYAASKGLSIGVDAPTREIELLVAMDFIDSHRKTFKGVKISGEQALQWPRSAVWIDSFPVDADEIPVELQNAQMEAAVAGAAGIAPLRTENTQNLQREKVDVIEVAYHNGGSWQSVRLDRVNVFLKALLRGATTGGNAFVIRA